MEKSSVSCSLFKFFCDGQKVNPSSKTVFSVSEIERFDKLDMSDFVALERCLGACILGLLVSEGSELGGCEVGMPDAKDVNRFCVIKSGCDFLIECLKHNLIYVGHSSQKLSGRFNGHRSDVKVKPKACELSQHFTKAKIVK